MGKRQELSENERQTVIGMPTAGFSQEMLLRNIMCIHPSSIGRLINQVLGQMETSIIGRVQTAHVKKLSSKIVPL